MLWLKVELIYGSKVGIFGRVFVFFVLSSIMFLSVQFRFLLFLFF